MPRVSVLMSVCRTKEAYLREAIESIINQTYRDFELVIVDDCPEDSREEVVRGYDDSRISYFKNDRNLGITPTRNRLLELARGEYVALFDHDDISSPERLEKEVLFLDAHPEIGVVGSWMGIVGEDKVYRYPERDELIRLTLMHDCPLANSSTMIRKSILDRNNIQYQLPYAEDYDVWCRLIPFTKFHILQEVLYKWRPHETNISRVRAEQMQACIAYVQARNKIDHAQLWEEYELRATHICRVKLFGAIKFLEIRRQENKTLVKMFGIPFLKIRKSEKLLSKWREV